MIREELFGASQPGDLSPEQLEAMKARLAKKMDEGAIGLSAGLAHAPGLMASTDEIIELACVWRRDGCACNPLEVSSRVRTARLPVINGSLSELADRRTGNRNAEDHGIRPRQTSFQSAFP